MKRTPTLWPATPEDIKPGALLLAFFGRGDVVAFRLVEESSDWAPTVSAKTGKRQPSYDGAGWTISGEIYGSSRISAASLLTGIKIGKLFVIERLGRIKKDTA